IWKRSRREICQPWRGAPRPYPQMDLCSDRQKQLGAGPTGTPQDAIARDESAKETRLPVLVRGCCKLQGGGGRRSAGRRFSWGRRGSRSASFSFNEEPHIRRCAQSCCLGLRKYGIHGRDRKSTRLNSSHLVISYAVFC